MTDTKISTSTHEASTKEWLRDTASKKELLTRLTRKRKTSLTVQTPVPMKSTLHCTLLRVPTPKNKLTTRAKRMTKALPPMPSQFVTRRRLTDRGEVVQSKHRTILPTKK